MSDIEKLRSHAESLGHYQLAKRGNATQLSEYRDKGIDPFRPKRQHTYTFAALTTGGYYYVAITADDEHSARTRVEDLMSDIETQGIVQLSALHSKEKLVLTPAEERTLDLEGAVRKYHSGKPHGIDIKLYNRG